LGVGAGAGGCSDDGRGMSTDLLQTQIYRPAKYLSATGPISSAKPANDLIAIELAPKAPVLYTQ
jgi:hypothetical protein